MATAMKFKIFLAGRVALERDGVSIDEGRFPGRQGRLLFAYLVAEQGRPVPRDELADALWGETPPATSDKALTVLASKLRGLLGELGVDGTKTLTSAFGSYRLNVPDGTWVDIIAAADALREAEAALAADDFDHAKAAAKRAASLARPSFLPGEEGAWVDGTRRELADILRRALSCIAEACLRSGDTAEAASWAEETIALEPYRETGYRHLMAAHAAAGNRAEALRVYERCRQLLATELGAYPSPETESIYRELLEAPAPQPRAEAPETAPVPATNLPVQPTPLVGRERELDEVIELLRTHRLLTLTGPGGIGKTRLALQAAAEFGDDFRDGVWFVSLASLRDPGLVLPTVAKTLGIQEPETLKGHLRERQALLLLDNFEQLLDAATSLAALLRAAPRSKLLVTSRSPLRVSGEQEYPVQPLADEEAARLFVERARAAARSFEATEAVTGICRRLDNLPLALELAAVRVKVLSPEALLARLEQRLPVLTGGARDLPERQRTLQATIEWSYDLLTPEEQELFARLAIFAGGFTIEAAEEVADADVDLLQALVDSSLLWQTDDRFSMLETIREFALERLERSGRAEQLRWGHAESLLNLAEDTETGLRGPDFRVRLDRLAAEHDNFRAALAWMLSQGELELELRLAASLQQFFEARGHFTEARRWLEAGLQRADELPVVVRARAVYSLGRFVELSGNFRRAAALHAEAAELFRLTGDEAGVVRALIQRAGTEAKAGSLERAETLIEESFELARALGDSLPLSDALHEAAWMAIDRGDRSRARVLIEESLGLRRQMGDPISTSVSLAVLGWLNRTEGELGLAARHLDEALVLAREANDIQSIAEALAGRGLVALGLCDHERAADLFAESLTLASAMGDRELATECLAGMAAAAGANGHPDRLAQLLGASESVHEAFGAPFTEGEEWILERFVEESPD
jgi:predicted ATPase/DNA-binding SARP family transcriptional activator